MTVSLASVVLAFYLHPALPPRPPAFPGGAHPTYLIWNGPVSDHVAGRRRVHRL